MDHRRASPRRARHRVASIRSGNGGTIEPRGSVVGGVPVAFDLAKRGRSGRLNDVDDLRRNSGNAHQPAALPAGCMRSFFRSRLRIRCHRHRMVTDGGMCLRGGMTVDMAVFMNVLRLGMNMNHSGNVILVRQAPGRSVDAGQRVGDRRRQYAKQIGKDYQPPCPQSLRSGQPDEHADINTFSYQDSGA